MKSWEKNNTEHLFQKKVVYHMIQNYRNVKSCTADIAHLPDFSFEVQSALGPIVNMWRLAGSERKLILSTTIFKKYICICAEIHVCIKKNTLYICVQSQDTSQWQNIDKLLSLMTNWLQMFKIAGVNPNGYKSVYRHICMFSIII